jgi:hypothetical protein
VVSVTDPYGRILGFLDRSRYFVIPTLNIIIRGTWPATVRPESSIVQSHNLKIYRLALEVPVVENYDLKKKKDCFISQDVAPLRILPELHAPQ